MAGFEVEHDFSASRAAVTAVLCDPAFQSGLDLPDLSRPEVMASSVDVPGAVVVIAVLAGGTLLGVIGALLAIPIAAGVLLVVREVVIRRQDAR